MGEVFAGRYELPTYAPLGSPQAIAELAEGAERVGLASLWTLERLLRPVAPVSPGRGVPAAVLPPLYASVYDPLETLSYVAARTSRIRLGTSVLDALFHPPVVLARRIATLDQLSGGRLDIGLGQGLIPQEFEAAGIPMSRRGNGYEEHIAAMRAVWAADPVRFDGRFYQIAESQIGPKPVQPGGPPLLGGAVFPAGIERIARMGLGFNVSVNSPDLADLGDAVAMFRQAAQNAGRDPGTLPVVVRVNGSVTVKPPAGERAPLTGSVSQVAETSRNCTYSTSTRCSGRWTPNQLISSKRSSNSSPRSNPAEAGRSTVIAPPASRKHERAGDGCVPRAVPPGAVMPASCLFVVEPWWRGRIRRCVIAR